MCSSIQLKEGMAPWGVGDAVFRAAVSGVGVAVQADGRAAMCRNRLGQGETSRCGVSIWRIGCRSERHLNVVVA